jgi:hypothetical protein
VWNECGGTFRAKTLELAKGLEPPTV